MMDYNPLEKAQKLSNFRLNVDGFPYFHFRVPERFFKQKGLQFVNQCIKRNNTRKIGTRGVFRRRSRQKFFFQGRRL